MVINIYNILDVSSWDEDTRQAKGTRSKRWLIHPETGQLVLAKWPSHVIGEVWAEKLASEIGKIIGVPVMHAEIGYRNGNFVSLAFNFLKRGGDRLIEGGDYFEGNVRGKPQLAPGYTYQNIKEKIAPLGVLPMFIKWSCQQLERN